MQHLTIVAERAARDECRHGFVDRTRAEAAAHCDDRHAFGRETELEPRARWMHLARERRAHRRSGTNRFSPKMRRRCVVRRPDFVNDRREQAIREAGVTSICSNAMPQRSNPNVRKIRAATTTGKHT